MAPLSPRRVQGAAAAAAGLAFLLAGAPAALAGSTAGNPQAGKAVFSSAGCAACHTFTPAGASGKVGPDLDQLAADAAKASLPVAEFAQKAITSPPPPYVPPGYPTNVMPTTFGSTLSATQIADLVAFLTGGKPSATTPAATTPAATTPAATAPAPAAGSAAQGKDLFTGAARFANGGPPCLSCHSIAGIGKLGGGAVGPDLTGAFAKWGGASGLASMLATLPPTTFPTMVPVFRGHPLATAEVADLVAFIQQAPTAKRSGSGVATLLELGGAGVAILFVAAYLFWPRWGLNVRRRLVAQSRRRS